MDRIVITIRPAPSDEGLLRVEDAMQQVLDAIKLLKLAEHAMMSPQEGCEWRLERASADSPFTVVAVAEPKNPTMDISPQVSRIKKAVARGIRDFVVTGAPADWMGPEGASIARDMLARIRGGMSGTDIDFTPNGLARNGADVLSLDREQADQGIRAFAAQNLFEARSDLPDREVEGEIEGVMIAAGRYYNKPAIQIRSEQYGVVWCILTKPVIDEFGIAHQVGDVWKGQVVAVRGSLFYGGGKLKRIEAVKIREVAAVPYIDLESILDPDFTSGMDPNEYLDHLHAGTLA
jgi:hypothetical protein